MTHRITQVTSWSLCKLVVVKYKSEIQTFEVSLLELIAAAFNV